MLLDGRSSSNLRLVELGFQPEMRRGILSASGIGNDCEELAGGGSPTVSA